MNNIDQLIKNALYEDSPHGDITQECLGADHSLCTAKLISKQTGVFCGELIINACATIAGDDMKPQVHVKDGQSISNKMVLAELMGHGSSLLRIERVMLNFIQRLSGIATITRQFVTALNNPNIQVLDTRKTTPGLRFLEKYAVMNGGGFNHRDSLSDMVLIKENHLRHFLIESDMTQLGEKIVIFKEKKPNVKIEVELESYDQLTRLPLAGVDYIMLDNFVSDDIPKSTGLIREKYPKAKIELSGNITLETIGSYRNYDIDRISVGALTHSVKAVDLSLLF